MKAIFKVYDDDTLEHYFRKEIEWTLSEKLEYNLEMQNSEKIINFAAIENVKLIVFSGSAKFKVRISTSSDSITFNVSDFFYFTPQSLSDITEIAVLEDQGTLVDCKIRFYGEEPES